MSRAFDAKQAALSIYPVDKGSGVSLFLDYLDISEDDFTYAFNETPEVYIYGKEI